MRFVSLVGFAFGFILLIGFCCVPVGAQSADDARAQIAAERYEQMLLRRPRPGTSLQRLYSYYIQAGRLDARLEELTPAADATGTEAGNRWLLRGLLQRLSGDLPAATEALQNAEQLLPSDATASYQLGLVCLANGDQPTAVAALRRAIDRQPAKAERLPIALALGKLHYQMGDDAAAEQLWDEVERLFGSDAGVSRRVAELMVEARRWEAAIGRYEQLATAAGVGADAIQYRLTAARLKQRLDRSEEALADLHALLPSVRPGSWLHQQVRQQIESILRLEGGDSRLATYYGQQWKANPDDLDTMLRLGQSQARAKQPAAAETTLRQLLEKAPLQRSARDALIEVLVQRNDWSGAAAQYAWLSESSLAQPDDWLQWGTALLRDESKPLEQRRAAAAKVWTALAEQRDEDAVTQVQLAQRLAAIEHFDKAEALLNRAIGLAPADPQYRERLGQLFYDQGRKEDAYAMWQTMAVGEGRSPEALLRLAEIYNTVGARQRCLAVLADMATLDLGLAQRLQLAGRLTALQDYPAALTELDRAGDIASTPMEQQQVWQQRITLARAASELPSLLEQTAQQATGADATPADFVRLATLLSVDNRPLEAIEALERALAINANDLPALQMLADLRASNRQTAEAIETLQQLADVDPRSRQTSLRRIANLQIERGQPEAALRILSQLLDQQPNEPTLWLEQADLQFQVGQIEQGYESLRQALRMAPRNADVLTRFAERQATDFHTDDAIELTWQRWELASGTSSKVDAVVTLARLYDRQLRLESLIEKLREQPTGRFGDAESLAYQIAAAYETAGNPGAAMRTLAGLQLDRPRDKELLRALIRLATLAGDREREIEWTQRLATVDPSAQTEALLLAALIRNKRFEEVTQTAVAAISAGRVAPVQSAARMLLEAGHAKIARDLYQQVAAIDPDEPTFQLPLAVFELLSKEYAAAAERTERLRSSYDQTTGTLEDATVVRLLAVAGMVTAPPHEWLGWLVEQQAVEAKEVAWLAIPIHVIARHAMQQGTQVVEEIVAAEHASGRNRDELWADYITLLIHYSLDPPGTLSPRPTDQPDLFGILHQLSVQGDPIALQRAIDVLQFRDQRRSFQQPSAGQTQTADWHLTAAQREWLASQLAEPPPVQFESDRARWTAAVAAEFRVAGRPEDARRVLQPLATANQVGDLIDAIPSLAVLGKQAELFAQLPRWRAWLGEVSRADQADQAEAATETDAPLTANRLRRVGERLEAFAQAAEKLSAEQRFEVLVTILAVEAAARRMQSDVAVRWNQPTGRVPVRGLSNSYELSPLLGRTLSMTGIRLLHPAGEKAQRQIQQWLVDESADVPADEQKLRLAVASAAWTWGDNADRSRAADGLRQATERFPDDDELRAAYALQLERLQQPREALQQWDATETSEPALLLLKELGIVRLASQLSDQARGDAAAARLLAMQLDRETKMIVTGQLMRLGLNDQASAFLAETRAVGDPASDPLIRVQDLFDAGNRQAAAECAYEVLRSGAARPRQRAIAWLQQLGRLPDVAQQLEQRRIDNPHATSIVELLASLNVALGRFREAAALRGEQAAMLRDQQVDSGDAEIELQTALELAARREFAAAVEHFLNGFALDAKRLEPHITPFIQAAQVSKRCDAAFRRLALCNLSEMSFDTLRDLMDMDPTGIEQPTAEGRQWMRSILIGSSPAQLGPLLRELRQTHRLGSQAHADAAQPLTRIFGDAANYDVDAAIWQQGKPNTDGTFFGSLEPILAAIQSNVDTQTEIVRLCEQQRSRPAAHAVATTLTMLLAAEKQPNTEPLDTLLAAEVSPLSGAFAWQAAQACVERGDIAASLIERLYRVATEDPALPAAYRGMSGGVGGKLFSFLALHRSKEAAREWLLEQHAAALDRPFPESLKAKQWQSIGARFEQLGYPLEAYRARDAATTGVLLPERSLVAMNTETSTIAEWVRAHLLKQVTEPKSPFDLLSLRPRIEQPPWETSLVAWSVRKLADDKAETPLLRDLQDAVNKAAESPANAEAISLLTLKCLLGLAEDPSSVTRAADELLDELLVMLPTVSNDHEHRHALWSLASIAAASEEAAIAERGTPLLRQLCEWSAEAKDLRLWLCTIDRLLSKSQEDGRGYAAEQLTQLAEVIASSSSDWSTSATEQLEVARVAVKHRSFPAATRSLGEALRLWRTHPATEIDPATQRTNTDYSVLRTAIDLLSKLLQADPQQVETCRLLETLVLPADAEHDVFLWPAPVDPTTEATRELANRPMHSLAGLLVIAAVESGRRDVVEQALEHRREQLREQGERRLAVDVLLAGLAIRAGDASATTQRIEQLLETAGEPVPAYDEVLAVTSDLAPWTKTIRAMRQSDRTLQLADTLLIALMVADAEPAIDIPAEIREARDQALLQVAAMLIADRGALRIAGHPVDAILEQLNTGTASESVRETARKLATQR